MAEAVKVRGAHLVGSVPLSSEEEVFRVMGEHLGDRLRRVPDGETGPRSLWIAYQVGVFNQIPELELFIPQAGMVDGQPFGTTGQPHFRVRDGADPHDVKFDNLGYADVALASYEIFEQLQRDGVIPASSRFQVSLPTAQSVVSAFLGDYFDILEAPYEAAMMHEVERILAGIPHDKLAMQWDVCIEVIQWEGGMPAAFTPVKEGIIERLARAGAAVSDDVELGFHLCYGDYLHEHMQEPTDTGVAVEISNAISAAVSRPIQWIHLPVPIERDDEAYFAPLAGLKLHPETELYLGLVHIRDGAEGAKRRIATAQQALGKLGMREFGVATECGMGRRPPGRGGTSDELVELLKIHAAVCDPVR